MTHSAPASITADCLRPGQSAYVLTVCRNHPLRRRLLELGCVRGAPLTVLRCAPGGDPVELRLGRTELALRRQDLLAVEVQL